LKRDWPENPRKRRDRLYIIAEILDVAKEGCLKTQIMYRANLSFAQLNEYLSLLIKLKLLNVETENEKTVYKITPKGVKYLQNYEEITSLLRKEEEGNVKSNAPIFWLKRTP